MVNDFFLKDSNSHRKISEKIKRVGRSIEISVKAKLRRVKRVPRKLESRHKASLVTCGFTFVLSFFSFDVRDDEVGDVAL